MLITSGTMRYNPEKRLLFRSSVNRNTNPATISTKYMIAIGKAKGE
jgi:hypothetical protein